MTSKGRGCLPRVLVILGVNKRHPAVQCRQIPILLMASDKRMNNKWEKCSQDIPLYIRPHNQWQKLVQAVNELKVSVYCLSNLETSLYQHTSKKILTETACKNCCTIYDLKFNGNSLIILLEHGGRMMKFDNLKHTHVVGIYLFQRSSCTWMARHNLISEL